MSSKTMTNLTFFFFLLMKSKELQRPRPPPFSWGTQALPMSQGTLTSTAPWGHPCHCWPFSWPPAHPSLLPGEERSAGPIQHLQKGSESPPHMDSRSSPAARLPWGSLLQVPAVGAAHRAARRRQGSAGGVCPGGPRRHGAGHSVLPAPCARQKPSNRIPLLLARSPPVLSKSP